MSENNSHNSDSAITSEKPTHTQTHDNDNHHSIGKDEDRAGVYGFETDESALPPGYFRSSFFIGSMVAICLGLFAGVSGFAYVAPILAIINADVGPDPNFVWMALSYTVTSAVCLTLVGRVSDIFGRRWIFTGGAAIGLIGSIVGATAQSVNQLIAATTLIGIAASTQLSYYYVMGELVPMRYRLHGNAVVYMSQVPGSGIAPAVANYFVQRHPNVSWRGCYYVLIAVNAIALICWFLFYHPPTFGMKHRGEKARKYIKEFDYVGTILYTGGLLILLIGLNWGGAVYPWNSANVIATIVIGALSLIAFGFWETFAKLKEPLVPIYVFNNAPWLAATIISGIGASVYYAFSIVWPSMVSILYTDSSDPMGGPWLSSLLGLSIVLGEIVGGLVAKRIGNVKLQTVGTLLLGGTFFALVATCTPDTRARAAAFVAIGTFSIGWAESLSITIVTLTAKNQNELGSASGIAGSIRFLMSSIASTIFSVVLTSQLNQKIGPRVSAAVTDNGLPGDSVTGFLAAITNGTQSAFEAVPGNNPNIQAVGVEAYKLANASAFRTVFLTTIAFTLLGTIAGYFLPNVDLLLTKDVATTLHKRSDEETKVAS